MHLHVHSNHSLLQGVASPRQIVARAVEHGLEWIALTDTAGLYGAIPFYQAAVTAGIKPLIGVDFEGTILLARTREGYTRLCEIVTAYHLNDSFDLADELTSGGGEGHLFALAADFSLIKRLCKEGLEPLVAMTSYGDKTSRYRAERAYAFARRMGLRAVPVNPVYFLDGRDAPTHKVLTAIRLNTTLDNLRRQDHAPARARFLTPTEMKRFYDDWPALLLNADWVAEQCDLDLSFGTPLFPQCSIPDGETPFSYLWKRACQGVQERYRVMTPAISKRLEYELSIIEQLGFAPYFLIVWDIVRHARAQDIPIMGRGSAANSLVAYALGITRADPFKYDLYFERFLNLARTDCPDIDLDICWRRRDDVIDYVYERYGRDRVAMISTLNTFKARAAVREVARVHGLTPQEATAITRQLPHYHAGDIALAARVLPESRGLNISDEPLKSIVATAERIDGFPRHLSIHSGGVVIAPASLTQFVPLQRATKGIIITQYDMGPIEDLGLVKMDLLGHRSLTVIDETVQKVWDNRALAVDVEDLPDPDPLTATLTREGRTIGCFQIESPVMRGLLRNTQAAGADMLMKTLSLVRPGPAGSGMKKRFIDRHLGREETTYLHPLLEKVLSDTYGVMLYQEDTLKVAHVIAAMDLAEADALRRAMTKKRSPREMARSMQSFLEKAQENDVAPEIAEEIWGLIANFAAYSYCKAHASSYGEVAYQCVYLKAHYPAEFLASVLTNRGGFYHPAVYVEEARRMGIEVLPPDVSQSQYGYTVEGEAIRVGFVEVGGLANRTIEAILHQRAAHPFENLTDLCRRTAMAYGDAEALIQAGACSGLGPSQPILMWELKMIFAGQGNKNNVDCVTESLVPYGGPGKLLPSLPAYSHKKRMDLQWTCLGLLTTTHPMAYYLPFLTDHTLILSQDMAHYAGRTVTMVGWLIAERRHGLKDRGAMKFITFEDPAGIFEGILFPETYQRLGHHIQTHGPYLITGKVQHEDYASVIVIDHIKNLGTDYGFLEELDGQQRMEMKNP
jgi:DNA-directed DNA polymerase III PolC